MLGFSIINVENPKNKSSFSNKIENAKQFLREHPESLRVIHGPVSVSEAQDVTEETPQTQSYVQTVPQTQSYVQYVPVYHKPDYKKIILVGGGIILFAVLLKKVIR